MASASTRRNIQQAGRGLALPTALCSTMSCKDGQQDTRELRCVVRYMPSGLDLRLMLGDEFRTTELHKDAPSVQARADEWRTALLERGWRVP